MTTLSSQSLALIALLLDSKESQFVQIIITCYIFLDGTISSGCVCGALQLADSLMSDHKALPQDLACLVVIGVSVENTIPNIL